MRPLRDDLRVPPLHVSHCHKSVVDRQVSGDRMHELHDEVSRLRRQVITELTELPLAPWRPRVSRRQRYLRAARQSIGDAVRFARAKV